MVILTYVGCLWGLWLAEGPVVGHVDEDEEVGHHAQHEPQHHNRVPAPLHRQVAKDAEDGPAQHLTDSHKDPGHCGQRFCLRTKPGSKKNGVRLKFGEQN